MTPDEVWSELDIAPTGERAVVRRAYAQRLKQSNPEDDPDGFKRLRAAYEMALAWVDVGGPIAASPGPTAGEDDNQPVAPETAPPREPVASDPFAEHWDRCRALMATASAGDAADDVLLADLQTILKSPVLDHLEVFQQTGVGLARAICEISPKANVLAWPVLTHFGWRKATLDWAQAPEVTALQDLARQVTDRQSMRENTAYKLLIAPPPRRANRDTRWERPSVMRMLRAARSDHTWLMSEFAPDTVKWWDRYGDPSRARRRKLYIWLAVAASVIALISLALGTDEPASITAMGPEQLAQAADAAPHDPALWAHLCYVTARHWWRETSLTDCDHAVTLNPGQLDPQLDRAFLYLKVGDHAFAEKFFSNILLNWPDNAMALYGRALARGAQDKLEEGRADWCRARQLDPKVRTKLEDEWEFRVEGRFEAC